MGLIGPDGAGSERRGWGEAWGVGLGWPGTVSGGQACRLEAIGIGGKWVVGLVWIALAWQARLWCVGAAREDVDRTDVSVWAGVGRKGTAGGGPVRYVGLARNGSGGFGWSVREGLGVAWIGKDGAG